MVALMTESALSLPSLVLNKHWAAIDATTVRRALKGVNRGRARIVEPKSFQLYEMDRWIDDVEPSNGMPIVRTNRGIIRYPEIILTECKILPKRQVTFCRRHLWKRDGWRCQYCGKKPRKDEITVDHIIPKSRGGRSEWTNCVLACLSCNKKKDSRSFKAAGMKLLRKPIAPRWNPLYAVNRSAVPASWKMFLKGVKTQDIVDTLYWDSELEP